MNSAVNRRRGRDDDGVGDDGRSNNSNATTASPRAAAAGGGVGQARGEHDVEAAVGRLSHPFRAEFNDHFETSMEALRDVAVVVDQLRLLLRPSAPENFVVYDPYYCAGAVVRHWNALGVQRVIHENRDFYADIANGKVPLDYDMLVTNPPFSGDHIERLFEYLVAAKKPFAFLVPDYIATKEWYRTAVRRHFTYAPSTGKGDINAFRGTRPKVPAAVFQVPPFLKMDTAENEKLKHDNNINNNGDDSSVACGNEKELIIGTEPFYVIPRGRYDFKHPKGVGNDHSHFRSMWFVWAGKRTAEVLRGTKVVFARMQREDSVEQRQLAPDVVHGIDALEEGHYVHAGLRPNPQRRAKQRSSRR